jgi:hypothetical protein
MDCPPETAWCGALLLTLNKPEGAEPFTDGALREARRVVSVPLSLELWEYSLLDDGPQRTLVKMAGAARALVGVP